MRYNQPMSHSTLSAAELAILDRAPRTRAGVSTKTVAARKAALRREALRAYPELSVEAALTLIASSPR